MKENMDKGFNIMLNNDPRDVLRFCDMMVEQAKERGDVETTEIAQDIRTIVDVFVRSVAQHLAKLDEKVNAADHNESKVGVIAINKLPS